MSQLAGNNTSAGAAGAAGGKLMARAILSTMYPGKQASDLTQDEKQVVSSLSQLAAQLSAGAASGSIEGGIQGAVAGKNAVENNALGAMAGSDLGFWLGKTSDCDTTCKAGIAKGVAEGNLIVSAGVGTAAGGAMIVAATPEIAALAKTALEGCKTAPTICLNNAGLQVAEAVTPGGKGAAGAIGVGKTAVEATAANVEAVAANAAKNTGKGTFSNISDNVAFSSKQLDKKFKHAGDFGVVTPKKNSETIAQYQTAIKSHLDNTSTYEHGTYLLVPESKVFYNPQTNNVVVIDNTGNFVSGWKRIQ